MHFFRGSVLVIDKRELCHEMSLEDMAARNGIVVNLGSNNKNEEEGAKGEGAGPTGEEDEDAVLSGLTDRLLPKAARLKLVLSRAGNNM